MTLFVCLALVVMLIGKMMQIGGSEAILFAHGQTGWRGKRLINGA